MRTLRIIGKGIAALLALLITAYLILVLVTRASNDRVWAQDHERVPEVTLSGSMLTVKDLRDFTYTGSGAITQNWKTETYDLRTLKDTWFLSSPFETMPKSSHTFLSFRFEDGRALTVTVEARRESDEVYNIWKGMIRQYELLYVWTNERDPLTLRVIEREDRVEVYRMTLTPEQGRAVLKALARRSEDVRLAPTFYNTVTRNCTVEVLDAMDEALGDAPSRFDLRTLLSATSAGMLVESGFIETDLSIDALRAEADATDAIRRHAKGPAFSDRIRESR